MKKLIVLLVSLFSLTSAYALETAIQTHRATKLILVQKNETEYVQLLGDVTRYITASSKKGEFSVIILVDGESDEVIQLVRDTLEHNGYKVQEFTPGRYYHHRALDISW